MMEQDGLEVEVVSLAPMAILLHVHDKETGYSFEVEYFKPYSMIVEGMQEENYDSTYLRFLVVTISDLMEEYDETLHR